LAGPDIFISYNREDVATARAFRDALAQQGYEVWWDATLRSGETYDEVTEAALRAARAVVVLWSPRSVTSRWVRSEATIADRNKALVPVTIESCDRPVMFELMQTAELSHWQGDADDPAWLAFLDDVRRKCGAGAKVRDETEPSPAASTGEGAHAIVALLPIGRRGADDRLEVLADELTEDITRELSQNAYFNVIAASAMASWRGKVADSRALGRELGADYLIEGTLQGAGDDVRLFAQIIEVATGKMLKSARFTGEHAVLAVSPEEFPRAVGSELGELVLQIETNRAMTRPGPFTGWEHLLRTVAYQSRPGTDSTRRALEEARLAIAVAPNLGLAHAIIANRLVVLVLGEGEEFTAARRQEIRGHATRAAQLDGDNPAVIAWLVSAYLALSDSGTSLQLAQRAAALNPHSTLSHFALGSAYAGLGRTTEAITEFREQDRLTSSDRFRPIGLTCLGFCCWYEGRLDEAEAALDRALGFQPDFELALKWKAIVLAGGGNERTALALIRQLKESNPAISLEQHARQISGHPTLGSRSEQALAIFHRLWNAPEDASGST
jgi:TolB-like protein/Flp pilus assembly protein TadD